MMRSFLALFAACLAFGASAEDVKPGLWKEFSYDAPDMTPIVFGGESRADGVHASDYCVCLDIFHPDGSATSGVRAEFAQGTHGWQKVCGAVVPEKPVKRIEAYALCRKGHGADRAEFRNLFLERRQGRGDRLFETRRSARPFADADIVYYTSFNGCEMTHRQEIVAASPAGKRLSGRKYAVWAASSMRRVAPTDMPDAADLAPPPRIDLDIAKRGSASAQVLVTTAPGTEWRDASLRISILRNAEGRSFSGQARWQRVGYIPRGGTMIPHPDGQDASAGWFADPLLPAAPFRVRKGATQALWVTVTADEGAESGVYSGEVEVFEGSALRGRVAVSVRVRSFSLPAKFGLDTSMGLMDGFLRATYPECWKRVRRQAQDIMLDYRLNTDDISRTTPKADIYCPLTEKWSLEMSDRLRAQGKRAYWHTSDAPRWPYANFANCDYPPIEGRLVLGFQTYLFRADGFCFGHVNRWNGKGNAPLDDTDVFLPRWICRDQLHTPGDGVLLYPGQSGVLPSVRLAQLRDGVQDYEWLKLAERRCGRSAVDAASRTVVRTLTDFTRDPAELERAHAAVGDMIEAAAADCPPGVPERHLPQKVMGRDYWPAPCRSPDGGADFLCLETTNASDGNTNDLACSWNAAAMFARGASRQFRVPWEWHFVERLNGIGASPNLLRRMFYFAYLNGVNSTHITRLGRDYERFRDFTQAHPDRGVPYTPVAICVPVAQGHSAFGCLQLAPVPGLERALPNSPCAQMYDVICPDAPGQTDADAAEALGGYKALVVVGDYMDRPLVERRLSAYRAAGGRVVRLGAGAVPPGKAFDAVGDMLAGRPKSPQVASALASLQAEFFPFKVRGDCLYGANRTKDGWWLWVFNNRGVTKFDDKAALVGRARDAEVSVASGHESVGSAIELLTGRVLRVSGGMFSHRVHAGDLAVFEIR